MPTTSQRDQWWTLPRISFSALHLCPHSLRTNLGILLSSTWRPVWQKRSWSNTSLSPNRAVQRWALGESWHSRPWEHSGNHEIWRTLSKELNEICSPAHGAQHKKCPKSLVVKQLEVLDEPFPKLKPPSRAEARGTCWLTGRPVFSPWRWRETDY